MLPFFIWSRRMTETSARVIVLVGSNMLPQVSDSIHVLASGVLGSEGRGALIVCQMPEGTLVGLGETDHGGSIW